MVEVRVYFDGGRVGTAFSRGMLRNRDAVLASARGAAEQVRVETERLGRDNIASAGNFKSARWIQGLRATRTEGGGFIRVETTHEVPYFWTHQNGAIIQGRPLLWIPLPWASEAKGVSARDYPGSLFRVNRKGKSPLLMSSDGEAKYSGHAQVTIPKRFRVVEIAREVANRMREFYSKLLSAQKGENSSGSE